MLVPAPVQTTYTQYINIAQNGMPASMHGVDCDTRIFEDESVGLVGIGFGLGVCQGANDKGARMGIMSGREFVGVTRADSTLPNIAAGFTDTYANGENMNIQVRGDIWVIVYGNVTPATAVIVDAATGKFALTGGTSIPNARWMTTATTGNPAILRLGEIPSK